MGDYRFKSSLLFRLQKDTDNKERQSSEHPVTQKSYMYEKNRKEDKKNISIRKPKPYESKFNNHRPDDYYSLVNRRYSSSVNKFKKYDYQVNKKEESEESNTETDKEEMTKSRRSPSSKPRRYRKRSDSKNRRRVSTSRSSSPSRRNRRSRTRSETPPRSSRNRRRSKTRSKSPSRSSSGSRRRRRSRTRSKSPSRSSSGSRRRRRSRTRSKSPSRSSSGSRRRRRSRTRSKSPTRSSSRSRRTRRRSRTRSASPSRKGTSRRRSRTRSKSPPSTIHPLNQTYTIGEDGKMRAGGRKGAPVLDFDPISDKELDAGVQSALQDINEKRIEKMLIEMRSKDRDRDRILRPVQMKAIIEKYKIPIMDNLDQLQHKFEDKNYRGNTNYEDLIQYLLEMKRKSGSIQDSSSTQFQEEYKPSKAERIRQRQRESQSESDYYDDRRNNRHSRNSPFSDREDAKLILELEKALLDSPKFDLDRFRRSLESKDNYGNDQVSRQHVVQAASSSNLDISKSTLSMLLQACDPTKRGIYHITKIIRYLERSNPHLLETRSSQSASSKHYFLNESFGLRTSKSLPLYPIEAVPPWEKKKPLTHIYMLRESPEPQNLEDLEELRSNLVATRQDVKGYMSEEELEFVCIKFNEYFEMNISKGRFQTAISNAKSMDPRNGLINIDLFYAFLKQTLIG